MSHLDDDTLAAAALDLLSGAAREEDLKHLQECSQCRQEMATYQHIAASLRLWRDVPPDAIDAGTRAIVQRARIYRLLGEMVTDQTLRRQAQRDPEGLLSTHGITPSPQLLAAFRELDIDQLERYRGELDERITKLLNLLT